MEEPVNIKATLLGWKLNNGTKCDPKWFHPAEVPEGYSIGGPLSIQKLSDKCHRIPSRFMQGTFKYNKGYGDQRMDVQVLVLIDNRMYTCSERGPLEPMAFTAGKRMPNIKGIPTDVDPQEFVLKLAQIVELQRKAAELYQQMYSAIAHEYGEW